VQDAASLAAWHEQRGGQIVVKPIRSAAGDCVSFCDTPADSVAAYERILATDNVFSIRNEGVVAQEYLVGGEYVVDTVSRDGQHHVTDFWKYDKITANGITDLTVGCTLLPRRGEVQDALLPYACDVLDALGIAYGAAHMEVKLTPTGPCLVEVGARMAGLDLPYFDQVCIRRGPARVDRGRLRPPRALRGPVEGRVRHQQTLLQRLDGLPPRGRPVAVLPIHADH
jgi:biotin carboxylase